MDGFDISGNAQSWVLSKCTFKKLLERRVDTVRGVEATHNERGVGGFIHIVNKPQINTIYALQIR